MGLLRTRTSMLTRPPYTILTSMDIRNRCTATNKTVSSKQVRKQP